MEKRLPIPISIAALCTLLSGTALSAPDEELTPTESIQLLEKVEGLLDTLGESRYGIHAASIKAYREASLSTTAAYDFYLRCYKLVKFESRDARESEYRDWKAKHVKWLRSKEHSEARRLQLEYLVLTLRAAQLAKPEELEKLVPDLTKHIDICLSRYASLEREGREILHEGAVGSIFGQAYELPSTLGHLKQWGVASLDIGGIYEKAIFPHYRSKARAGELATAWDKRIAQQTELVGALGNPEAEAKFVELTLPRLRWARYIDQLKAGQESSAINGLVGVAQANLRHPEIDGWLNMLAAILSGSQDPPSFDDD